MSVTHLDEAGRARMVDVSAKATTVREATAEAVVVLGVEAAAAVGVVPVAGVAGAALVVGVAVDDAFIAVICES